MGVSDDVKDVVETYIANHEQRDNSRHREQSKRVFPFPAFAEYWEFMNLR